MSNKRKRQPLQNEARYMRKGLNTAVQKLGLRNSAHRERIKVGVKGEVAERFRTRGTIELPSKRKPGSLNVRRETSAGGKESRRERTLPSYRLLPEKERGVILIGVVTELPKESSEGTDTFCCGNAERVCKQKERITNYKGGTDSSRKKKKKKTISQSLTQLREGDCTTNRTRLNLGDEYKRLSEKRCNHYYTAKKKKKNGGCSSVIWRGR